MIIQLKRDATKEEKNRIIEFVQGKGITVSDASSENCQVLGLIGDTSSLDISLLEAIRAVETVTRISTPFKKASRAFHPADSVIKVGNLKIGGKEPIVIIGGPCAVENEKSLLDIAVGVKKCGAVALRGGAYKPRTSPYAFQGLGLKGLELLDQAKAMTGLPVVTEITSADKIDEFIKYVDIIQVGARNMQNFELLKALGKTQKPILLKRGFSNTIEEWLMSAEYIMAGGNPNVILCERGIRTFEKYTRNTLDLSVVPLVKQLSHLPIVIDPSHATGKWDLVEPMSLAAIAAGCDGLIIEVHNDPEHALSDGAQSLKFDNFEELIKKGEKIANVIGRKIAKNA